MSAHYYGSSQGGWGMCAKALWKSRQVFCQLTIVRTVVTAAPCIGVSTEPSVTYMSVSLWSFPELGTPRASHLTNVLTWE